MGPAGGSGPAEWAPCLVVDYDAASNMYGVVLQGTAAEARQQQQQLGQDEVVWLPRVKVGPRAWGLIRSQDGEEGNEKGRAGE